VGVHWNVFFQFFDDFLKYFKLIFFSILLLFWNTNIRNIKKILFWYNFNKKKTFLKKLYTIISNKSLVLLPSLRLNWWWLALLSFKVQKSPSKLKGVKIAPNVFFNFQHLSLPFFFNKYAGARAHTRPNYSRKFHNNPTHNRTFPKML
jgi:hypothetical protein